MLRKFEEEVFVHYRTGVAEMDRQHWDVLQVLVNVAECQDIESAVSQLDLFMSGWKCHLAAEEAYMASLKFPFQDEHKKMHKQLFSEYDSMKSAMRSDRFGDIRLRNYAKSALKKVLDHIDHYDQQYARWKP